MEHAQHGRWSRPMAVLAGAFLVPVLFSGASWLPVSSWKGVVVLQLFFEAQWTEVPAFPLGACLLVATLITEGMGRVLAHDFGVLVCFVSHKHALTNSRMIDSRIDADFRGDWQVGWASEAAPGKVVSPWVCVKLPSRRRLQLWRAGTWPWAALGCVTAAGKPDFVAVAAV